ncbi:MAG: hypothetical protein HY588_00935 [Candidatus Omnitrophica bacterium]|nr:hypothetical protein [Candidatus Omnitrophota bacterium]
MPLSDIEKIMQKNGYPAKNLKRVSFTAYDPTGRALKVSLEYARSKVLISAGDFRLFLGPDRLRSLKAGAEIKGDHVHFHGLGWGHGVGFCQWGAKGQAEAGRNYREIIQHYFPGSELKKIY